MRDPNKHSLATTNTQTSTEDRQHHVMTPNGMCVFFSSNLNFFFGMARADQYPLKGGGGVHELGFSCDVNGKLLLTLLASEECVCVCVSVDAAVGRSENNSKPHNPQHLSDAPL